MPNTKQIERPEKAERASPRNPLIAEAKEKLAYVELKYAETVLTLDALLVPYYSDTEIRRKIAECSDVTRSLYRRVLSLRRLVESKPNELSICLLEYSETGKATKRPRNPQELQSLSIPAIGNKSILQRDSVDLQQGFGSASETTTPANH
jgi:hypothetical protein